MEINNEKALPGHSPKLPPADTVPKASAAALAVSRLCGSADLEEEKPNFPDCTSRPK